MEANHTKERVLIDGRYEVHGVLGAGGNAVVYLAKHLNLGRMVALKVVRREAREKELDRLMKEARIVANLRHPNIVTLHDAGSLSDGRPYLVMECVTGQSLHRLIEYQRRIPIDLCLSVFYQVAQGLGHAHRHGVIHRDIKFANILLEQHSAGFPIAKVADFGIASLARDDPKSNSSRIGTPLYMSPEQVRRQPILPQSDLYSLGIVMYRALTGVKPIDGASAEAITRAHVHQIPTPIEQVAPDLDLPEGLADLIMRCLEKDPLKRPSSAEELLELIEPIAARHSPIPLWHNIDGSLEPSLQPIEEPKKTSYHLGAVAMICLALILTALIITTGRGTRIVEIPVPIRITTEVPVDFGPEWKGPIQLDSREEPASNKAARTISSEDPLPLVEEEEVLQMQVKPPAMNWRGTLDGKEFSLSWVEHNGVVEAVVKTRIGLSATPRAFFGFIKPFANTQRLTLHDGDNKGWSIRLDIRGENASGTFTTNNNKKRLIVATAFEP